MVVVVGASDTQVIPSSCVQPFGTHRHQPSHMALILPALHIISYQCKSATPWLGLTITGRGSSNPSTLAAPLVTNPLLVYNLEPAGVLSNTAGRDAASAIAKPVSINLAPTPFLWCSGWTASRASRLRERAKA